MRTERGGFTSGKGKELEKIFPGGGMWTRGRDGKDLEKVLVRDEGEREGGEGMARNIQGGSVSERSVLGQLVLGQAG